MKKIACKILAIVFLFMLTMPIIATTGGETYGQAGGSVKCSTNLQLIPQAEQIGGGHITWTIEGESARELRQLLIKSIGNDEFYDIADGGDTLTEEELAIFLDTNGLLESYIQRGGALESFRGSYDFYGFEPLRDIDPDDHIKYFGAEITRSSLNTDNIADDTRGLIGADAEDTGQIKIDFTIRFHESPGRGGPFDLKMSETEVLGAVFESLIIPIRQELETEAEGSLQTEFVIEHDNLLSDEDGNYGVVLRNGVPMHPDNYTINQNEGTVTIEEDSIDENDEVSVVYAYSPIWEGESETTHWSYVVGTNNFYDPDHQGSLYLFRTPAGEILYYSNSFSAGDVPDERISWVEFDILMNPQILFVIVAVFSYFIAGMPKKYYKDYRSEFPGGSKDKAEKARFLHILTKLTVIALLVLYFFPVLGPFFVKGIYLMVLAPALMVASVVLSKTVYARKKAATPDDVTNPRKKKKKTRKKAEKNSNKDVKKIRCDRCGEVFTVPKRRNLLTVDCPVCSKPQRQLKEGYNYLLLDEGSDNTYSIYKQFIRDGLNGLIITTTLPSKVKEKQGLYDQEIKWISRSDSEEHDTLDPNRMEFETIRTISKFAEDNDRAVILIEGLEYLMIENDFSEVVKFVKKVTDITSMNAITLLVSVNPDAFSTNQITTLKKSFDNKENLILKEKKTY